jgi:hypothetical protein
VQRAAYQPAVPVSEVAAAGFDHANLFRANHA